MFLSKLGLVVAGLAALMIVGYPLYLLWGYATQFGFYSPLNMREYSGFCAVAIAGMAAYVVAGAVALNFKDPSNG
jgi:hypothetical protein